MGIPSEDGMPQLGPFYDTPTGGLRGSTVPICNIVTIVTQTVQHYSREQNLMYTTLLVLYHRQSLEAKLH